MARYVPTLRERACSSGYDHAENYDDCDEAAHRQSDESRLLEKNLNDRERHSKKLNCILQPKKNNQFATFCLCPVAAMWPGCLHT